MWFARISIYMYIYENTSPKSKINHQKKQMVMFATYVVVLVVCFFFGIFLVFGNLDRCRYATTTSFFFDSQPSNLPSYNKHGPIISSSEIWVNESATTSARTSAVPTAAAGAEEEAASVAAGKHA